MLRILTYGEGSSVSGCLTIRILFSGPAIASSSTFVLNIIFCNLPVFSISKSTATNGASSTLIPTFSAGVTRK